MFYCSTFFYCFLITWFYFSVWKFPWSSLVYYSVILVVQKLSVLCVICTAPCHFRDLILWITTSNSVFCLIHSSILPFLLVNSSIHRAINLYVTCGFVIISLSSKFRILISLLEIMPFSSDISLDWIWYNLVILLFKLIISFCLFLEV